MSECEGILSFGTMPEGENQNEWDELQEMVHLLASGHTQAEGFDRKARRLETILSAQTHFAQVGDRRVECTKYVTETTKHTHAYIDEYGVFHQTPIKSAMSFRVRVLNSMGLATADMLFAIPYFVALSENQILAHVIAWKDRRLKEMIA